jgi:Domain of unknown function (DUF5979)
MMRVRSIALFAVLAVLTFSNEALARENYTGSVVAECNVTAGASKNVRASATAPSWLVTELTYVFTPTAGGLPQSINAGSCSGCVVAGSGNKVARFAILPPGAYAVTVNETITNGLQANYQITVPQCTPPSGSGSLTVRKTVINTTGKPILAGGFSVSVNCGKGGTTTTVNVGGAGGNMQTVAPIPIGKTCTIQELTAKAPPDCHWVTTYPQGTTVTIAGQMAYLKEVVNRLVCKGMPN